MKKAFMILLMMALCSLMVGATSYYFSQSGNDGSGSCSSVNPCKTINKLNSLSLNSGDKVYFNRGDVWRCPTDDYIDLTNGVNYGAYGTGERPIFLGSYNLSSDSDWIEGETNVWSSVVTKDVGSMIMNEETITGVMLWEDDAMLPLDVQGEFYYNESTNNLSIYSTSNPGTYYDNIEAAVKPSSDEDVIGWSGHSNIKISNVSVRYFGVVGIGGNNAENITLEDFDMRFGGGDRQNEDARYGNCVDLSQTSTNIRVSRGNITQCYDGCITIQAFDSGGHADISNVEIDHNIATYCHYPLEYFSTRSQNNTIDNVNIHHNTFTNGGEEWSYNERPNGGWGQIRLSRTPAETTRFNFTDNIIYTKKDYAILMGSLADDNWLGNLFMDRNLYFNESGNVTINYNGSAPSHTYQGLAEFRVANPSQEVNGLEANPLFITGTYQPNASSPACNMGLGGSYVGAINCYGADEEEEELIMSSVCRI
jgi:hypothetical protein